MVDELRKILLAGVGSAAYTYEKAFKTVEDLVSKGKLTIEEGKELSEELKRNAKDTIKTKTDQIKPLTKEDMISVFKEMNFATKDDLANLEARIAKLESEKNQ